MFPDRRPARAPLTLAQRSNLLGLTARHYDAWRARSLGLLSGQPYPLERELDLLATWLAPRPGERALDVGTSTGTYARALARRGAKVTAVDLSPAMLDRAAALTGPGTVEPGAVAYELANAEALPYRDASFDLVAVGASLNEFARTERGLAECARVLRPDGRLFLMYWARDPRPAARALQLLLEAGGVRFPPRETVACLLGARGLRLARAEQRGPVALELYRFGAEPAVAAPARPLGVAPGKRQRAPLAEP